MWPWLYYTPWGYLSREFIKACIDLENTGDSETTLSNKIFISLLLNSIMQRKAIIRDGCLLPEKHSQR